MPQYGETATEGTINQWLKNVGDAVSADDALVEISTDKANTEIPAQANGRLAEVRVQEGEDVEVGTVLAVIDDETRN
jgi:2-oxoglutarate dehydrogenase E2 component (dihydrolipoamide succinyltransferase)